MSQYLKTPFIVMLLGCMSANISAAQSTPQEELENFVNSLEIQLNTTDHPIHKIMNERCENSNPAFLSCQLPTVNLSIIPDYLKRWVHITACISKDGNTLIVEELHVLLPGPDDEERLIARYELKPFKRCYVLCYNPVLIAKSHYHMSFDDDQKALLQRYTQNFDPTISLCSFINFRLRFLCGMLSKSQSKNDILIECRRFFLEFLGESIKNKLTAQKGCRKEKYIKIDEIRYHGDDYIDVDVSSDLSLEQIEEIFAGISEFDKNGALNLFLEKISTQHNPEEG